MKAKKLGCLLLATMMVSSSLVACGGGGNNSSDNRFTDEQKAQMTKLTVGVYNGGLGRGWADELKLAFEEMYKDLEIAGKKGVYVEIQAKKDEYGPLIDNINMGIETADVYINTGSTFDEYVQKGVALEITDMMNEKVYDENGELSANGTKSLAERINPYFNTINNFGTTENPKYYNLPYEWGLHGFIYDHDLFEDEGWLHYSGLDGTPKTTTEFIQLLGEINKAGYAGWISSLSNIEWYWYDMYSTMLAQYEGEDQALLNLTYNGVATFAANTFDAATCTAEGITTEADGTQKVTITNQNAWLLAYQNGKQKIVEFADAIVDERYYDSSVANKVTFGEAQTKFISSIKATKQIAMLFDGEWWENEGRSTFNELAAAYPDLAYGKRDFRLMPMPQIEGGKENDNYGFFALGAGPCFINKNTKQADLAKKWIQLMYSNTGANIILKNNGMTLPLTDMKIKSDVESQITPFAKSVYKIKTSDECKVYMAVETQPGVSTFSREATLSIGGYVRPMTSSTDVDGKPGVWTNQKNPVAYFVDNPGKTAADWLAGVKRKYTKEAWMASYNNYAGEK